MPTPDLSLYIPVVCETDSIYAGHCYMEKISAVCTLNGNPISKDTALKKSDFKTGDAVTLRFQNRDFRGTVDFSRDEEILRERSESVCLSSTAANQALPSVLTSTKKRKRHRSWDSPAAPRDKREKKEEGKSPVKRSVAKEARNVVCKKPRAPGIILAGPSHHLRDFPTVSQDSNSGSSHHLRDIPTVSQDSNRGIALIQPSGHVPAMKQFSAVGEIWPQLVEARLENMSLKLTEFVNEVNKTIEKSHSKIILAISDMKDELLALKRRQDLVFKKQDIIQSTLAGEIPSNMPSFRPPAAAPSVVTWSPPFPSRQIQSHQPQQPQPQPPHHTHLSGYSSPVNVGSISNEDIQSFLSFDLETDRRKRMKNTPQDDPIDCFSVYPQLSPPAGTPAPFFLPNQPSAGTPAPSFPRTIPPTGNTVPQTQLPVESQIPPPTSNPLPLSQAGTPLPSFHQTAPQTRLPSSHQLAEAPLLSNQNSSLADFNLLSSHQTQPSSSQSLQTSVGILLSELGLLWPSASEHTRCSPSVDEDRSQVYTPSNVSSMEELSRNNPIPRGDVSADVVINAFILKNNTLDVNNVGRLAVLLARYAYYGDEVLQESTLKGKGKRPGLDPKVFDLLVSTIHNRHPFSMMSPADFRKKIRPKIERSLTDYLKPKSKKGM